MYQLHSGISSPLSLLKCSSAGVIWMCRASFSPLDNLARVLRENGYPTNFIHSAYAPPPQALDPRSPEEDQQEKESRPPVMMFPYVVGMSKGIRHVCRKFDIRVVFKSGQTLYSMLTKVKNTLPIGKQSNVLYHIPCICSQVCIGETKRRLETRLKGHWDACERGSYDGKISCGRACVGEPLTSNDISSAVHGYKMFSYFHPEDD